MIGKSVEKYIGKNVFLTIKSGFWYKCKIISADDYAIEFIELKGRRMSISPEQITMIEEERK